MVSVHELKNIVSRLTYKPGFQLSVVAETKSNSVDIIIKRWVTDAETGKRDNFESVNPFSLELMAHIPEETVISILFAMIMRMEEHEAKEFFKLDGKSVYEAHVGENKSPSASRFDEDMEKLVKDLRELKEMDRNPKIVPMTPSTVPPWILPGRAQDDWPSRSPTIIDRKCENQNDRYSFKLSYT